MGILARILDLLFPLGDTARIVRETSSEEFSSLLAPRVTKTGVVALLPYRHRIVRAVIREAKFKRSARAFELLATVLADYLAAYTEEHAALDDRPLMLIPLPLGPKRRHERGYNQIEEVVRRTGTPYDSRILVRTRDTRPQTTLSRRERLQNVQNVFRATRPDLSYTYVLVDDVVTTGATLEAAGAALRSAGTNHMVVVALAY